MPPSRRLDQNPRSTANSAGPTMKHPSENQPQEVHAGLVERVTYHRHTPRAGAAARAADERGVRSLQPHIYDSPRNQLNSRSIGDGRCAVHVSANKALAVCGGFSKLLKTLRQRAQDQVRQRDAGQDIYFGRRNRCMIAPS
jgi:hypothetical protein